MFNNKIYFFNAKAKDIKELFLVYKSKILLRLQQKL